MGKSYEDLLIELEDAFQNLGDKLSWCAGRDGRDEVEAAAMTARHVARSVAAACKDMPVIASTPPASRIVALKGTRIADIHSLVDEAICDGKRGAIFISVTGDNGACKWQACTRGERLTTAEVVFIAQGLSKAFLDMSPTNFTVLKDSDE